jgi:DNA-binding GntR family transcriptional regulator
VLKLEEVIRLMEAAAQNQRWTETALLNARFHETVVRIADNRVLDRIWRTLHPLAWLLASTSSPNTAQDSESLVVRHQALLEALQAGEPDNAEEAFRQHILNASRSTSSERAFQEAAVDSMNASSICDLRLLSLGDGALGDGRVGQSSSQGEPEYGP